MTVSAIYAGRVMHQRSRPRRHRLSYAVFTLLLDLDELPELDLTLPLFGHNRPAAVRFDDADHGDGRLGGLKDWVAGQLAAAGLEGPDLRVQVLCYPRLFGYVFNPLSVFFCRFGEGPVAAVIYEVCNTFGERHSYVIPVVGDGGEIRQSCAKGFYVSPFVPMDCRYEFRLTPPDETVRIAIEDFDADGPLLVAVFSGARQPLTAGSLRRLLLRYPLMTLKVMAAIHWEALRLWAKGLPVFRHRPAPQRRAVAIIAARPSIPTGRPGS